MWCTALLLPPNRTLRRLPGRLFGCQTEPVLVPHSRLPLHSLAPCRRTEQPGGRNLCRALCTSRPASHQKSGTQNAAQMQRHLRWVGGLMGGLACEQVCVLDSQVSMHCSSSEFGFGPRCKTQPGLLSRRQTIQPCIDHTRLTVSAARRPAAFFGQQPQAAAIGCCLNAKNWAAGGAGRVGSAVGNLHSCHTCRALGGWAGGHGWHTLKAGAALCGVAACQSNAMGAQQPAKTSNAPLGVHCKPEQHSAASRHEAPSSPRPFSPAAEQPAEDVGASGSDKVWLSCPVQCLPQRASL